VLEMMYTSDQRQEFLKAAGRIEDPCDGLEQRVDNLICLSPLTHRRWSKGLFAFEPIPRNPEDEDRKQSLIFHWMPNVKPSSTGYYAAGEHPEHEIPPADDTSESSDLSTRGARLYSCDGSRIFTGHRIEMTTDDPELRPLPSYELLRLQWDLQRLMHLRAASEPKDLSGSSESGDEDYFLLFPDFLYA
jgi:hypothetical protein